MSVEDIQDTYEKLNDAAGKGYGKDFGKTHGDLPEDVRDNVRAMKQNIYKFSAAKDHTMLAEINDLLYDGDRLKTFEEFKKSVEQSKIGENYKEHWLEAEYRTAVQSGYMAAKWASIEANKALFPNLKYKTQGDDRVRKEHDQLDGIIAPIDSPFWDKYYPPNGWRCRCDAIQTAEPTSTLIPTRTKLVKPEFEINIGKSGQVYNEDSKNGHRFFALAKSDPKWAKRLELSKLEAGFENIKTPKGNKVKESIYADVRLDELQPNRDMAMWATDTLGYEIEIMPKLNGKVIKKASNPEYRLNGNIVADRKAPKSIDYSKILSKANKQGCKIVFISLDRNNDNIDNALKSCIDLLSKTTKDGPVHPKIEEIYIVDKDFKSHNHYKRKKQP